jgi:hypothetical protein
LCFDALTFGEPVAAVAGRRLGSADRPQECPLLAQDHPLLLRVAEAASRLYKRSAQRTVRTACAASRMRIAEQTAVSLAAIA